jgi:RHS repeat-associated protein
LTFFPFGDCRFSQGTLATDRLFTGQRLDDTGLYYYGARYYDATIGRFISPDTVVSEPYNPQNLNRYSYCLNNPLKYTDPSGHDKVIVQEPDGTYTIMDGDGKVLADKINGIDDLAQKMKDVEPMSRQVDLPLQPKAEAFFHEINEPESPTFNSSLAKVGIGVTAGILIDDTTGIGFVDDVVIPLVWVGVGLGWVYQNRDVLSQGAEYISYNVGEWWDSLCMSRAQDPKHHTGKSKATNDKHTRPRSGDPGKKQQQPGWKDRSGYRR